MIKTQRGITLPEVLVTLAIVSLIGSLIWSVFFQGYRYSQKAVTKNKLQQEANLFITNLTRIQQTSSVYTINNPTDVNRKEGCKTITVTYTKFDGTSHSLDFNTPGLCYSSSLIGEYKPVDKAQDNKLDITIIVWDENDQSNSTEIDSVLYRLN